MSAIDLILEYLKVLLSPQCVGAIVILVFLAKFKGELRALIDRIGFMRLPGGAEFSTAQRTRLNEVEMPPEPSSASGESPSMTQRDDPTTETTFDLQEAYRAERSRAYLWEYRYLNYYLVPNTQSVLDWLALVKERVTYELYDSVWLPSIPSAEERQAIMKALEAHHLIQLNGSLIGITPKGHEYRNWRGTLPVRK